MDGPDQIGPDHGPRRTVGDKLRRVVKTFTTRDGLLGNYDYAYLFTPRLPFTKRARKSAPFFGLEDRVPVVSATCAVDAGWSHLPPIILGGSGGVNFGDELHQYLVSASLIASGFLSAMQMARFRIFGTKYFVGTGLLSVVGTSFATITVATGTFSQMYKSGYCPLDADGNRLPCPRGYGALLGTSCLCALLEIGLSFTSSRILSRIFPALVTGPTVLLIGASLIQSGMQDWAGGTGCVPASSTATRPLCPSASAPHALPWGSPEFIGLGFLVFVTIILCERFGPPILKSCAVVVGLVLHSPGSTHSPLSIYPPLILPLLALYIVLLMESIGDIAATCDVSRLAVQGATFDSRIQGGVLGNGLTSIIAGLMTISPMSVFAQNNGVIALTKCANRTAGFCCCFFLVLMGVFAKFAAALVSIPSAVLGGMTTFLFSSVAVSGIRIISTIEFTRRNRFILTASFSLGMGITLVPNWWGYVFTYQGDNHALEGLLNAVDLVMQNGFAVCAILGVILNLIIPEEADDVPAMLLNSADVDADGTGDGNGVRGQMVAPVEGLGEKREQSIGQAIPMGK
ncbi:Purine permease [Penicillium diatomitis]|uniref:Purine permease n=1 Tax=Penicillium diatomitis TaxID=2819901 RepID=A0A9W9WKG3_9EURO|nr:Purine permease [Penicillium diatomitis]KAJ5466670.1 Purine permease [Penicillium diatomitis]